MPPSASAPPAIPKDDGLHLSDTIDEYPVRFSCERKLSHLTRDLWNANLSMVNPVPEREFGLEKKTKKFDAPSLPSCKRSTLSPLDVIAAMTRIRIQASFSCKQKRREPPGAYALRNVILLWHTVSSMARKRSRFFIWSESRFWRDKLCELSECGRQQVIKGRPCYFSSLV